MKFLGFAALFALTVIPLMLSKKEKERQPHVVESDLIYDFELTVD
ncbi:MAG: hypothetical protein O7D34_10380 [Ignavibacteria bacterium]|nr:hypothetical protein [Ignavibacteria bacterium]